MKLPWRSAPAGPGVAAAQIPTTLIKPYHPDVEPRGRARLKRYITISLVVFCFIYGFTFALLAPFLLVVFAAPIAILAILAVWALPDARVAPTRTLEFLFYGFLVSLIVWPNYLAIALPGLPWITLVRLFAFPATFVLLVCVSISQPFRKTLADAYKNIPILWITLVLFICIQAFSIGLSAEKGDSLQKFFIDQIYWSVMYVISTYVFLQPGRAEKWAGLLWATIVPIALISVRENQLHHVIWAGHIPGFLKIEDKNIQMLLAGIYRSYTNIYRVQATASTSLGLAEYLALLLPFVIHFAIGQYTRRTKYLAVASLPVILYVILISGSRLGVLGFGITSLIYPLIWAILKWKRERGGMVAPAVVLAYPAFFAAAVAASFFVGRIKKAVWGGGASQSSTDSRMTQIHMGIPKILHNPFGYGVGQGADVLGYYTPGGMLTIDTYYLLIALEYGVAGFIVYYGMIALYIYFSGKAVLFETPKQRELTLIIPAFISLVNFIIIKSAFAQADNHPLIFMLMGMVVALLYRIRLEREAATPAAAPQPAPGRRPAASRID